MAITKEEIAQALGVSVKDLLEALATAKIAMTNRALEIAVTKAREKSSAALSDARNELAPALQKLAEQESAHAQAIAQIESARNAYAAGEISEVPDVEAIIEGIK